VRIVSAGAGADTWRAESWYDGHLVDDPISSGAFNYVGYILDPSPGATARWTGDVNYRVRDLATDDCRTVNMELRLANPASTCAGCAAPVTCDTVWTLVSTLTETMLSCSPATSDSHEWTVNETGITDFECGSTPIDIYLREVIRVKDGATIMSEDLVCILVRCAIG
jgi:hypothetical protein